MNITKIKEKMDDCLFSYITPLVIMTDIISKKIIPDFVYEYRIERHPHDNLDEHGIRILCNPDGSITYLFILGYLKEGIQDTIPFEDMPIHKMLLYAPTILQFAQDINDGKFIPKQKNV